MFIALKLSKSYANVNIKSYWYTEAVECRLIGTITCIRKNLSFTVHYSIRLVNNECTCMLVNEQCFSAMKFFLHVIQKVVEN